MVKLHDVRDHQRRGPRQSTLAVYQNLLPLRCGHVHDAGKRDQIRPDVGVVPPPAVVVLDGGHLRLQVLCLLGDVNNYIKGQDLPHRGLREQIDPLREHEQRALRVHFAHFHAYARNGLTVIVHAAVIRAPALGGQRRQIGSAVLDARVGDVYMFMLRCCYRVATVLCYRTCCCSGAMVLQRCCRSLSHSHFYSNQCTSKGMDENGIRVTRSATQRGKRLFQIGNRKDRAVQRKKTLFLSGRWALC